MKKVIISALVLAPSLTFAALGDITNIVQSIKSIVSSAIPIAFGILVIAFFWGLAKFIFSAGDETAQKGAKSMMLYSIVAMFIAGDIWGIIRFIGDQLNIDTDTSNVTVPTVPGL